MKSLMILVSVIFRKPDGTLANAANVFDLCVVNSPLYSLKAVIGENCCLVNTMKRWRN